MKIDGGCHCGKITYEADVDPENCRICHCTDCQKMSGSAFRAVVPVPEDKVRLLSGEVKVYVKTAESGNKRAQAFCPDCGTHLWATSVGDGPRVLGLRTSSANQRDKLIPKGQIWTRSAQPWVMHLDDLPKAEKQT